MLNTYVVEGGVGKCTAFTALLPKLKEKSEVQIYTHLTLVALQVIQMLKWHLKVHYLCKTKE